MIEIQMSKDIKEFDPKVFGPFTKRQMAVVGLSVLVGGTTFVLIGFLDWMVKLILSLILVIPIILCGWVKIYNIPLEVFIMTYVIPSIFGPKKRKYMAENEFETALKENGRNKYKPEPILRSTQPVKKTKKEQRKENQLLAQYGAAK